MSVATTTIFPQSDIEPRERIIDADTAARLGSTLYIMVEAALSDREILDETLDYWYSLLEMWTPPRNSPWPNASSVVIPVVPAHFDTLSAQVAQQVFRQRLFLVTPNTPQAAEVAHKTEYYFNAKAQKLDLYETFNQLKDMGLRDGAAFLEVLYKHTKRREQVVIWEDDVDPKTGVKKIDLKTGKPKRKPTYYTTEVDEYNDVYMEPIELRDFVLIPSWQLSIDEAHAVARKLYLDENELLKMINAGYLDAEQVGYALNFVTSGSSERSLDEQGQQTVTIGGKVLVGAEEGVTEKSLGQARGPIMVWRIHTNSFTLLRDLIGTEGIQSEDNLVPDEYVIWLHHQSQRVLGYKRYEYGHGKRPFVPFVPMPRPRRAYGWSIIERLAPIASETFNLWNGRNDMVDLITRPSMYRRAGAKIVEPQGLAWGPSAMWEVQHPDDVGFIGGGRMQIDFGPSIEQEQILMNWANLLTGASMNAMGSPNSGRRTAREVSSVNMNANIRVGWIANRLRRTIEKAFWMWRQLQVQYGKDEEQIAGRVLGMPQQMTVTREDLTQDFQLAVAGSDGQLDQDLRAQQALQTYLLLHDDPDIATDPIKRYRLKAYLLEAQNNTNIVALIGTEQEAEQRAQAEAQQRQMQMQMQQLAAQGVQVPGAPPPGQGHPPPHPQHQKPPVKPGQLIT